MASFGEWRETTGWKRREILGNVSSACRIGKYQVHTADSVGRQSAQGTLSCSI
jgi:hypothetical protein